MNCRSTQRGPNDKSVVRSITTRFISSFHNMQVSRLIRFYILANQFPLPFRVCNIIWTIILGARHSILPSKTKPASKATYCVENVSPLNQESHMSHCTVSIFITMYSAYIGYPLSPPSPYSACFPDEWIQPNTILKDQQTANASSKLKPQSIKLMTLCQPASKGSSSTYNLLQDLIGTKNIAGGVVFFAAFLNTRPVRNACWWSGRKKTSREPHRQQHAALMMLTNPILWTRQMIWCRTSAPPRREKRNVTCKCGRPRGIKNYAFPIAIIVLCTFLTIKLSD